MIGGDEPEVAGFLEGLDEAHTLSPERNVFSRAAFDLNGADPIVTIHGLSRSAAGDID
jgi:hypothetical protein